MFNIKRQQLYNSLSNCFRGLWMIWSRCFMSTYVCHLKVDQKILQSLSSQFFFYPAIHVLVLCRTMGMGLIKQICTDIQAPILYLSLYDWSSHRDFTPIAIIAAVCNRMSISVLWQTGISKAVFLCAVYTRHLVPVCLCWHWRFGAYLYVQYTIEGAVISIDFTI